jgi:hypothetical protein
MLCLRPLFSPSRPSDEFFPCALNDSILVIFHVPLQLKVLLICGCNIHLSQVFYLDKEFIWCMVNPTSLKLSLFQGGGGERPQTSLPISSNILQPHEGGIK